ncbi:TPA_asm: hypothetical protein [Powellomyces chytrid fungus MELD virus 2]|nr:TPA_asm: hypothetical protein [Powellomyces chytrid fungus MELD virus 2]
MSTLGNDDLQFDDTANLDGATDGGSTPSTDGGSTPSSTASGSTRALPTADGSTSSSTDGGSTPSFTASGSTRALPTADGSTSSSTASGSFTVSGSTPSSTASGSIDPRVEALLRNLNVVPNNRWQGLLEKLFTLKGEIDLQGGNDTFYRIIDLLKKDERPVNDVVETIKNYIEDDDETVSLPTIGSAEQRHLMKALEAKDAEETCRELGESKADGRNDALLRGICFYRAGKLWSSLKHNEKVSRNRRRKGKSLSSLRNFHQQAARTARYVDAIGHGVLFHPYLRSNQIMKKTNEAHLEKLKNYVANRNAWTLDPQYREFVEKYLV